MQKMIVIDRSFKNLDRHSLIRYFDFFYTLEELFLSNYQKIRFWLEKLVTKFLSYF